MRKSTSHLFCIVAVWLIGFPGGRAAGQERQQNRATLAAQIVGEVLHVGPPETMALLNNEYLAFVGGSAAPVNGIYRVDLNTWTISGEPIEPGDPKQVALLKDKNGREHILLSLDYVMRHGDAGMSYALMTVRESKRRRSLVSFQQLVYVDQGDHEGPCPPGTKGSVVKDARPKVQDINGDAIADLSFLIEEVDCRTGKSRSRTEHFLATESGFQAKSLAQSDQAFAAGLRRAHKAALAEYRKSKQAYLAVKPLEVAGVREILDRKPPGLQVDDYVRILNDYAFLVGPHGHFDVALDILDRVIGLAPERTVAYLNRAEVLLGILRFQPMSHQSKLDATREILHDYARYRELGGAPREEFEQFAAFSLVTYPEEMDVCGYVQRLHKEKWFGTLPRIYEAAVEARLIDIDNDGKPEVVRYERARHRTYSSNIVVRRSDGKEVKINPVVRDDDSADEGFRVIQFKDKVYQDWEARFVTEIVGTQSRLVCESEWEDVALESNDDGVCQAVIAGNLEYGKFDGKVGPNRNPPQNQISVDTSRRPGFATIDIDNDGRPNQIAAVSSGENRPAFQLVDIDPATQIPRSNPTNRLLLQMQIDTKVSAECLKLPFGRGCRAHTYWTFEPFSFGGKVYVDRYHDKKIRKTDREILKLEDGKSQMMCRLGRKLKRFWKVG